jgi:hypothetical protein
MSADIDAAPVVGDSRNRGRRDGCRGNLIEPNTKSQRGKRHHPLHGRPRKVHAILTRAVLMNEQLTQAHLQN